MYLLNITNQDKFNNSVVYKEKIEKIEKIEKEIEKEKIEKEKIEKYYYFDIISGVALK